MKILIFDSSTIITLSLNSLLYILEKLHEKFDVKFIITEEIKYEVIDKPLQIKRFELEALMVNQLLKKGILEMPESIGIGKKQVQEKTSKILRLANNSFLARGRYINLLSAGESSCFALGKILEEKNIECSLAIDERTARMLSEKPENLKMLLERKLHTAVKMNKDNLGIFLNTKIIRSSELCYIAYKNHLVGIEDGRILVDAMLYAAKYKGCAISTNEIEEMKKLI